MAWFLVYWLAVYGLFLSRWNAPKGTPDIVQPVLEFRFLLALIAGALVSWWRGGRAGRIPGGMLAGATILAVDCLLVLAYGLIPKRFSELSSFKAEFLLEALAFVMASSVIGSLLGLIGVLLGFVIGPGGDRGPASRERQETL